MSSRILNKPVTRDNIYRTYIKIMNGILGLTSKEVDILSEFMYLNYLDSLSKKYLNEATRTRELFSNTNRKIVRERLGISTHNLNNYINILKEKEMILEIETTIEEDNKSYLYINPKIMIPNESMELTFRLVMEDAV